MNRLTNRLERVERAAKSLDPANDAWRVCCSQSGETSAQAIERHRAIYGRGPKVVVPAKRVLEEVQ